MKIVLKANNNKLKFIKITKFLKINQKIQNKLNCQIQIKTSLCNSKINKFNKFNK